MLYTLWMTVSGLVLSLVLAEAHSIRLLAQDQLLTNKNSPPPWGAIPQSICEEGAVETEGCLGCGGGHPIRDWSNGVDKSEAKISMGLVQISWQCCCRNGARASPISSTISRMALISQVLP